MIFNRRLNLFIRLNHEFHPDERLFHGASFEKSSPKNPRKNGPPNQDPSHVPSKKNELPYKFLFGNSGFPLKRVIRRGGMRGTIKIALTALVSLCYKL
jgi:hypothetical protein